MTGTAERGSIKDGGKGGIKGGGKCSLKRGVEGGNMLCVNGDAQGGGVQCAIKVGRKDHTGFFSGVYRATASVTFLAALIWFALFHSSEAGELVLSGMQLAVMTVLPSAFVSMLVCDLYRCFGYPERIPLLGWAFSRLFGVSPHGLRAFVLGNLCGFPMGAREVGSAYRDGVLSRGEAEWLLPISTNPSPAFIVGAVGGGMMGDFRAGIRLFFCVLLSSAMCGVTLHKRGGNFKVAGVVSRQNYNVIESIRSAGTASVTLISFISGFYAVLGFIKKYVGFLPLRCLLFALCEVTGGVAFFTGEGGFSPLFSGVMTAFTLGFGGVSVMLQSAAFASELGLKMRWYFGVKLLQGAVCAGLYYLSLFL